MHFLDTSILLYSISGDPVDAPKREISVELLNRDDGALSLQILQDFYVQATRISRRDRISHELAIGLIEAWSRFPVQDTTMTILWGAMEIRSRHHFSYWDSAVLAAARALGCSELFSEDMSHGRVVDGVRITNPFL